MIILELQRSSKFVELCNQNLVTKVYNSNMSEKDKETNHNNIDEKTQEASETLIENCISTEQPKK